MSLACKLDTISYGNVTLLFFSHSNPDQGDHRAAKFAGKALNQKIYVFEGGYRKSKQGVTDVVLMPFGVAFGIKQAQQAQEEDFSPHLHQTHLTCLLFPGGGGGKWLKKGDSSDSNCDAVSQAPQIYQAMTVCAIVPQKGITFKQPPSWSLATTSL